MGIVLQELVLRPDGTIGLGNSLEVESEAEAIALVQDGKAKFEGLPIGVIPSEGAEVDQQGEEQEGVGDAEE